MGKANDVMCNYLSNPDAFADYWNGVLFGGEERLRAEELEPYDGNYYEVESGLQKGKGRSGAGTHSRRRDVVKRARSGAAYVIFGVENQQEIAYDMPVRHMEYDAMEYSRQVKEIARKNHRENARRRKEGLPDLWRNHGEFLSGFRKEDKLIPVITTVFYHGDAEYDGCTDIHGMLNLTQEQEPFREYIGNYPMRLVTWKDLPEEKLQTGLRELTGVMKRSRDKEALLQYCTENEERFRKLDEETRNTMDVLLRWQGPGWHPGEEGGSNMLNAIEMEWLEGKKAGQQEGRQEGRRETLNMFLGDLGPVPEVLRERIEQETDEAVLSGWIKLAARAGSMEEFAEKIGVPMAAR